MPFSGPFVVRSPNLGSESRWVIEEEFTWHSPYGDVVIEKGYTTDGVSTPRILWVWCPPMDAKATRAALPHDKFYTLLSLGIPHPLAKTRKEADDMFYLACRDAGITRVSSYLMWAGVRLFGRSHVTRRDSMPDSEI
jgi:hypothetical protein